MFKERLASGAVGCVRGLGMIWVVHGERNRAGGVDAGRGTGGEEEDYKERGVGAGGMRVGSGRGLG